MCIEFQFLSYQGILFWTATGATKILPTRSDPRLTQSLVRADLITELAFISELALIPELAVILRTCLYF